MRLDKYRKIYFKISTLPPAASMASFAFALTAFTLNGSAVFNSPSPNIFTLSVLPINPLIYRLSTD